MPRLIIFLLLLVPLTQIGLWFAQHPGVFQMNWLGYHIEISMSLLALIVSVFAILCLFFGMSFWWLMGWPARRALKRRANRADEGLQLITHALIAAGQNNYDQAHKALQRAGNILPHSPITHLIGAQISAHHSKPLHTRDHLLALTKHASTAKLALQQSLRDAMARHDTPETTRLLAEAMRLYPRERFVMEARVRASIATDDVASLIRDLERITLRPVYPSAQRHHLLSELYFQRFQDVQALRHDPCFVPAACRLAITRAGQGKYSTAIALLRRCWKRAPATPIIDALLEVTVTLPPKTQQRIAKRFARMAGGRAESEDIQARFALRLEQLDDALTHAKRAMEKSATRERFTRIAEIVAKRDGAEAANLWLKEALQASHHEGWFCEACGTQHSEWKLLCNHCDAIDTIQWKASNAPASEIVTG
jgi:HemY protein